MHSDIYMKSRLYKVFEIPGPQFHFIDIVQLSTLVKFHFKKDYSIKRYKILVILFTLCKSRGLNMNDKFHDINFKTQLFFRTLCFSLILSEIGKSFKCEFSMVFKYIYT